MYPSMYSKEKIFLKTNYSIAPATRAALFNFRELWTVQGASNFGLDINRCTVYGGNTYLFSRSLHLKYALV